MWSLRQPMVALLAALLLFSTLLTVCLGGWALWQRQQRLEQELVQVRKEADIRAENQRRTAELAAAVEADCLQALSHRETENYQEAREAVERGKLRLQSAPASVLEHEEVTRWKRQLEKEAKDVEMAADLEEARLQLLSRSDRDEGYDRKAMDEAHQKVFSTYGLSIETDP